MCEILHVLTTPLLDDFCERDSAHSERRVKIGFPFRPRQWFVRIEYSLRFQKIAMRSLLRSCPALTEKSTEYYPQIREFELCFGQFVFDKKQM